MINVGIQFSTIQCVRSMSPAWNEAVSSMFRNFFQASQDRNASPVHSHALPKLFLIGHNKAGTRSFHRLLRSNGYSSIHYDKGNLCKTIRANFIFSKPLLSGIDHYCGYTDMELNGEFYGYRLFPLFDLQYPGSYFIYNYRDVDRWVDSRMRHRGGKYAENYLERMRLELGNPDFKLDDLRANWVEAWHQHEHDLKTYFRHKNNFFKFDITSSVDQASLCALLRKLGYRIKGNSLPHVGARKA